MNDGFMVFTKKEKWKKIELSGVFKAEERFPSRETGTILSRPTIVDILGSHEQFLECFESLFKGIKE